MEPLRRCGLWALVLAVFCIAGCSGDQVLPDTVPGEPDGGPLPCDAGQWDHDEDPTTTCVPWSDCVAGTYQISEGTATADRLCGACKVGTFSTSVNARQCAELAECPAGTRIIVAGTPSSDRVCMLCEAGTYNSFRNSSVCAQLGECAPGTYQTAPGSILDLPKCEVCTAGSFCAGGAAEPSPCGNGTWDDDANPASGCLVWSDCPATFAVSMQGSATSDRVCSACADGTYPTGTNATTCLPPASCEPGFAQTATNLTVCEACAAGTFCAGNQAPAVECAAGTWDNDADPVSPCVALRACGAGTYVSDVGSATTDRTCNPCADGSFSNAVNAGSCAPWTACSADTYEAVVPSAGSDRQCASYTSCLDRLTRAPGSPSSTYVIDPDGTGVDSPILVRCDMTTAGGGWTEISFEDFASSAAGWSDANRDTSSSCFTNYGAMLGGYKVYGSGATSSKTYDLLGVDHSEVRVNLDYYVIDSWDGERAQVRVGASLLYDVAFSHNGAAAICGEPGWGDQGPQGVTVTRNHTSNSMALTVTSTLNQPADDESFGVDNVRIMVR